jgi:hypothetical protein
MDHDAADATSAAAAANRKPIETGFDRRIEHVLSVGAVQNALGAEQ